MRAGPARGGIAIGHQCEWKSIRERRHLALNAGQKISIVGDNVNWFINVHDERLGHTSHMCHAFASAVIIDNVATTSIVSASASSLEQDKNAIENLPHSTRNIDPKS